MAFFEGNRYLDEGKFARNLQLAIIGVILFSLVLARMATGMITVENALFYIVFDGAFMFIMFWYAHYVWRNF